MNLWDVLRASGLADGVVFDPAARTVLEALETDAPPAGAPFPWSGSAASSPVSLPELLGLSLPGTPTDWTLDARASGFDLMLTVHPGSVSAAPASDVMAATRTVQGTGSTARVIYAAAGPLEVGLEGVVTVTGSRGRSARISIDDVTLRPTPREVLLPAGFGLRLPDSITFSDGAPVIGDVELVLPAVVPLLGGLSLPVAITPTAGGLDLDATVKPADGPNVRARLGWNVPGPLRLAELVPTSLDAVLAIGSGAFSPGLEIDEPMRVRATASRPPRSPGDARVAVTLESDAREGLASFGPSSTPAARAVGTAVVLAPAVAALAGATGPAPSAALLSAAAGLAPTLANKGGYTLHGAVLEAVPADGEVVISLDISGVLLVNDWKVSDLLQISMSPDRPMMVRWRDVRATIDQDAFSAAGATPADALDLDFANARAEIVDAGGWTVRSEGDMFEIVGTRSGSGSTWFEIDLRFTYDLGPIRVTGATVRATWDGGTVRYGIRGLAASFAMPGLIEAGGSISLTHEAEGAEAIEVVLWGELVPLKASGFLVFRRGEGEVTRYEFALGVDLPVPIPLGPTGLSLYTVAAAFGTNAAMPRLDGQDPLRQLRGWQPWNELVTSRDNVTLGAGVVVGTAVDDGFTFSSLGVLGLTVPDFAVRIGLDASFLASRRTARDLPLLKQHASGEVEPGASLFGGLAWDDKAIDIGVVGSYRVPALLDVEIPVAAHFGHGPTAWFLHAGSDEGINADGKPRAPAPLRAVIFPDIAPLRAEGWAFVMVRGEGIHNLAGTGVNLGGAAIAVGVGFAKVFGARGVLWAEIGASVIAAVATQPFMFWAKGTLAGSIGLGPFELGVDAEVTVRVGPDPDDVRLYFIVCAEVDLWLTTLRGCIEIGTLENDVAKPPVPSDWPFPRVTLADGLGRLISDPKQPEDPGPPKGSGNAPEGGWTNAPTVWPDVIPLLTFPIAPVTTIGLMGSAQNAGLTGSGEYRFEWHLNAVTLEELDPSGNVVGTVPLSNAAWQAASEDTVTTSGLRQLALLTTSRGVSMVHRAGEIDADGSPLGAVAGLCQRTFPVVRAWSLGVDARSLDERGWHVPGRFGPFAPLALVVFSAPVGFSVSSSLPRDSVPPPALHHATGPYRFDTPQPFEDTTLRGALRLEGAAGAALDFTGEFPRVRHHTVVFDEPVADGDLYLLVSSANQRDLHELIRSAEPAIVETEGGSRAAVIEPHGELPDRRQPPSVIVRIAVAREGDQPALRVTWTMPADLSLSVLGLHATAWATKQSAERAQNANDAVVADDDGKFDLPSATRTMLKAGTRYRLSVEMGWSRWKDGDSAPQPGTQETRSWYFRTATNDPIVAATAVAPWKGFGALPRASSLLPPLSSLGVVSHSRFDPAYLERYLDGYSIADRAAFVFRKDYLSARFRAVHIVDLAAAFGRDVRLLLRRTDREDESVSWVPKVSSVALQPNFSLGLLVAEAATIFGCRVPSQAVELGVHGELDPNAPYELSVALPPQGATPVPGHPELSGIAFSTSAYFGPHDLMEAFGLVEATAGEALRAARASGDLPVTAVALAAGRQIDDTAFEAAAAALGLPPLRPATAPRSSILWARTENGWGMHGLLLESIEPLFRDAGKRMSLGDAALGDVTMQVNVLNRAGTRALWLMSAPVPVFGEQTLTVTAFDGATPFTRRLTVAVEPLFARASLAMVA